MSSRTAFLFPGQGSYIPGLFADLIDDFPSAARTLESIDSACVEAGAGTVSHLLTSKNSPSLEELIARSPELVDTVIFASNMAANAVLREAGYSADVLVGHSFGELSALTAAGSLSLRDATHFLLQRLSLLSSTPLPESGMLALELDARRTAHLVGLIDDRFLTLALDNAPERCVVSGTKEGLEGVVSVAQSVGVTTHPVPAARAFHNPMLKTVEDLVSDAFNRFELRAPKTPVYSSMLRRHIESVADIQAVAAVQLTAPVYFREGFQRLHADGVRRFIEAGAKAVLSSFATETLPIGSSVVAPFRRRSTPSDLRALFAEPGQPTGVAQAGAFTQEPVTATASPEVTAAPIAQQPEIELPQLDELFEELRVLYAEKLELPEELLDDEADLEADFGVDSLQQVALFNQARTKYGLPEPGEGMRVTSFTRLRDVAGLLHTLAGEPR